MSSDLVWLAKMPVSLMEKWFLTWLDARPRRYSAAEYQHGCVPFRNYFLRFIKLWFITEKWPDEKNHQSTRRLGIPRVWTLDDVQQLLQNWDLRDKFANGMKTLPSLPEFWTKKIRSRFSARYVKTKMPHDHSIVRCSFHPRQAEDFTRHGFFAAGSARNST